MKYILITLFVFLFACTSLGSEYVVLSDQTDTIERSSKNIVTGLTRVIVNTVNHKDTITEKWEPSVPGFKFISRETISIDTSGNTITTVEERFPNSTHLKITSKITLTKWKNGSSITTTETLQGSNMVITKRTIVTINNSGHIITTEETMGTNGTFVVTKQIMKK